MIAACPRCSSRFRLAAERLRTEGVRLRCTRCQCVFRVYPPHTEVPRRRDDPAVDAELTPPPRPPDPERLVLVADGEPERAKAVAAEVLRLGLQPLVVHDGVEAILALHRTPASSVVMDSTLPVLSGIQLCEILKRNESLRATRCLLVGTSESLGPSFVLRASGFGPDASLEHADLPEGLEDVLRRFGRLGVAGVAAPPEAAPPAQPPPQPFTDAAPPAAPPGAEAEPLAALPGAEAETPPPLPGAGEPPVGEPPGPDPGLEDPAQDAPDRAAGSVAGPGPWEETGPAGDPGPDPALQAAERLARIVVSDIVLYNGERFERAAREGTVLEELAAELEEGRALFRQRVPAHLLEARDFLADEMLRVARTRAQAAGA